jgi:hypothetical protein
MLCWTIDRRGEGRAAEALGRVSSHQSEREELREAGVKVGLMEVERSHLWIRVEFRSFSTKGRGERSARYGGGWEEEGQAWREEGIRRARCGGM